MTKTMAGEVLALMIWVRGAVRLLVQWMPIHSMPLSTGFAHSARMLADAAGENQRVEPSTVAARPRVAADAGDEIVDRLARRWAVGGLELAHVLGNARQALEARCFVEQIGISLARHLFSAIR